MNEGVNQVLKRVIAEPRPSRSWYILSNVLSAIQFFSVLLNFLVITL